MDWFSHENAEMDFPSYLLLVVALLPNPDDI
jgi:hypothetical protein